MLAPVRAEFCGQVLEDTDPKRQKTLQKAFKTEAVAAADKAAPQFCCVYAPPFNAFV